MSIQAARIQRQAELLKQLKPAGTLRKNKRARKKAKRKFSGTAVARTNAAGSKRWMWWAAAGTGVALIAGSLFKPVRGLLRGLGIGGVDHPEAWAVDRSAAALDEAARETSDAALSDNYSRLSQLVASGGVWGQDRSAADILIGTAAMINYQAAPVASSRLRLFMADRGVSWKSGGTVVTDAELAELEDVVGWRSMLPAWRPSLGLAGAGASLVLVGIVGTMLTRRKKR